MPDDPPRRLVGEVLAPREYARLRRSGIYAGWGVPRGDGRHVLLVPGFLSGDMTMNVLRRWLRKLGYVPRASRMPPNVACAERAVTRLEQRLEEIAAGSGDRVALVGHSRGGQFARVLGVRRPDLVAGVVTLGAPPLNHRAVSPAAGIPAVAITALGTLGFPGFLRFQCFLGSCCERFRRELRAPFPREVGFVQVVSRADAIVDHRLITEFAGRRVDVRASHGGFLVNHEAFAAIADALRSFDEGRYSRGAA